MWLVVFVSHNSEQVKKLITELSAHKILTKVTRRKSDVMFYEVYVPQTELQDAQNLIFDDELFLM